MAPFKYLIHFETEDKETFFAKCDSTEPVIGASMTAYGTFEDLTENRNSSTATIAKVERPPCTTWHRLTVLALFAIASATSSPFRPSNILCRAQLQEPRKRSQRTCPFPSSLLFNVDTKTKQLNVPSNPPLWTKPAAALSAPNAVIPVSRFCASHLPDWEVSLCPR